MHLKWNNAFNRVLASSVVAMMATTSLNAIPRGPCEPPPPQVCCDEPKPGPFAFAYPMDMNITCPRDFYVHGDFIAFQAKQDGMQWAMQNGTGPTSTNAGTPLTNGQVEGFSNRNNDWAYNFGARFGMGFYLDHDAWNVDFNWTWLNITDYKRQNATTGGSVLIPLYLLGGDTDSNFIGQRSSASWRAQLNTLDARLGKPFHVSRYLVVNPHFGIRAAWIDQHFGVDYSGFVGSTLVPNAGGTASIAGNNRIVSHNDNDFWGFGARAGIDTDWIIGKGWCLFGNLASSVLFGKFEIEQQLTTPATNFLFHGSNIGYNIEDHHYMNVPNCEIALGLGWGQYFNKSKYHIGLKAGYEFHVWFDQLNLRRFWGVGGQGGNAGQGASYPNDVVSRGNLTLNGFTFNVKLDM